MFLLHLKKAVGVLKPIVMHQKRFDKNTALPSEVYSAFPSLPGNVDAMELLASERSLVKNLVASCFDFVYGDAHGVAFLLDPRFNGAGMDVEINASAETFIVKWHGIDAEGDVLIELSRFKGMVKSLEGSQRLELLNSS